MGDFKGHPFRGNQYVREKLASSTASSNAAVGKRIAARKGVLRSSAESSSVIAKRIRSVKIRKTLGGR